MGIDFRRLAEIASEVGALLVCDIGHVSGLVIARLHDNPTPYSDVVTTSTHKTFCGPRTGGLILCKQQYAAKIEGESSPVSSAARRPDSCEAVPLCLLRPRAIMDISRRLSRR